MTVSFILLFLNLAPIPFDLPVFYKPCIISKALDLKIEGF